LGGHLQRSGSWRRAAFSESICGAGGRAAWTSDREHTFLPRADGTGGASLAIVVAVLWVILAVRYKQYLAGIFVQNAA
jgi:hypothetical protein